MHFKRNILYISLFFYTIFSANAQEGLPIYSDYLTDNYYLLYPSMAGVSNCGKVRMTGRKQWFDQEKAPELQTLSVNTRIGDSRSAIGAIVFNDMNGYHSQSGAYLTYAHHILFSRSELDLDMLSFGISAGMIQYKLDETSFLAGGFDPIIAGIEQSATDFNIDFGFSYQYLEFYAHASIKNLLNNDGINFNCEHKSEKIDIPHTTVPHRVPGRMLCLEHEDEGLVERGGSIKWKKGETTARNERRFVHEMQQGKWDYKSDGIKQVKYELVGIEEISPKAKFINIKL